jgi:hypothetical protein
VYGSCGFILYIEAFLFIFSVTHHRKGGNEWEKKEHNHFDDGM